MTLKGYNKYLLSRLNILREKYGEPYNICKGIEIESLFWKLISSDSQKVKNEILMRILQYFSDNGYIDKRGNRKSFEDDAYANTIFLSCNIKGI
jgi:hypothetical protein